MTTIVWAPGDLIVATHESVDVRFAGVELTTDVAESLGAVITDKLDTDYSYVSGYAGGTGSEWDGCRTYLPGAT